MVPSGILIQSDTGFSQLPVEVLWLEAATPEIWRGSHYINEEENLHGSLKIGSCLGDLGGCLVPKADNFI